MTTGTRSYGDADQPRYYYRSWSGSDGKTKTLYGTQWNSYWCLIKSGSQVQGRNICTDPNRDLAGIWPNYIFDSTVYWTSQDELELQARLVKAARGHSFNLGVALGERRQTVALVTSTVSKCYNAVRHLKKGRIDLALRNLGAKPQPQHSGRRGVVNPRNLRDTDISNMWLEIQYGWKPLLSDVYESAKAYAALTSAPRTSRFSVRENGTVNLGSHPVPQAYNDHFRYTWNSVTSKRIQYVFVERLDAPRSLGLENPLSVAWELVPFSFVADWFIPIGTYLDNLSIIPQLDGAFLVTTRTVQKGEGRAFYSHWYYSCLNVGAKSAWTLVNITRTPTYSAPRVANPTFKNIGDAMSLGHMRNAFALLHQVVRK